MKRPQIHARTLALVIAAYVAFFLNAAAFRISRSVFEAHPNDVWLLGIGLFLVLSAFFISLTWPWIFRPMAAFFILISAAAAYFMDTFGTVIDKDMIVNAATTTGNEAQHLITTGFFIHMLLFGALPVALIFWPRLRKMRLLRDIALNSVLIVVLLLGAGAVIFSDYAAFSSALRERKDLVFSLNPIGPVYAVVKYVKQRTAEKNIVAEPIGLDVRPGQKLRDAQKPVFMVLVVGETLRAKDFGLDGSGKETTPELAAIDPVNFTHATSCGTATAVSMPCMFSKFARSDYSDRKALSNENLLDILQRAGFSVEWWDNNTGDKEIAARVPSVNLSRTDDPAHCVDGECRDSIFLDRLRERMQTATGNTLIVLHQIGSHGPAYYLRYPPEFEKFKPACHSPQFSDCTSEGIRNAYDNSVLFTDHFLGEVIRMAQQNSNRIIPSLIFVSDHGESLGENGLYLHGAPWLIAPDTQTHVPFIAWFSPQFGSTLGLDEACIRAKADLPVSHDNYFHSVLGALDIETTERNTALDLFGTCRN